MEVPAAARRLRTVAIAVMSPPSDLSLQPPVVAAGAAAPRRRRHRYRAGIIGLGFIGGGDQWSGDQIGGQQVSALEEFNGYHSLALDSNPDIELVTGSSRDHGRRQRFADKYSIPLEALHTDWRTMLQTEKLDIVSICTYTPQHEEMTVACAEAGVKAVWCEKPVAPTMAAAENMMAACESANATLFFNHVMRWDPNMRRLAALVQSGGLGPVDGSMSAIVQWGSGRLGVAGTHFLDAIVMIFGQRVIGISATLDKPNLDPRSGALTNGKPAPDFDDPGAWATLRLEGGTTVTVNAANATNVTRGFDIFGMLGNARTQGSGETVDVEFSSAGHFERHEVGEDGERKEGGAEAKKEHWERASGKGIGEGTMMDIAAAELVAHLDGKQVFGYGTAEGVHSLEIILGIHASHAKNGEWVTLPLLGVDRQHVLRSG